MQNMSQFLVQPHLGFIPTYSIITMAFRTTTDFWPNL